MNSKKSKNIFRARISILVFLLVVIFGGLVLNSVSAAVLPGGLVPCGNGSDPSQRCTLCHLVLGFQGIIDWGFDIFIFLALLTLVVAGVIYIVSTGDQGLMTTAKGIMMNTLFGFAFVLLAWLLVNYTIYLLGAKVGLEQNPGAKWNEFTCDATRTPMDGSIPNIPDDGARSNCTGKATAHSSPCDNINPSSPTPRTLLNRCSPPSTNGKCFDGCNDGYSMKPSPGSPGLFECIQDQIVPCVGSGSCEDSCTGGKTEFVERNSCSAVGKKCCVSINADICKSSDAKDPWVGACFKDGCLESGWTKKTGVFVVRGIRCQVNNWTCCVRNP